MKQLRYQQTAVRRLVDCAIDLLRLPGHRKPLIFKAPTGSGKTVMVSQMLSDLTVELQSRGDSPFHEVAFMWIAPNKLHFQSYSKMKGLFDETHLLRPVMYDELDHADGFIHPGEILFVNWESVNKDNALIIRDSEQGASLYDITRRTQEEQGIPIVVVIDEEHLFWSRTADKSSRVLQRIQPKLEIRVSATPKTYSDYIVNIPREQVVEEEMIKKQVVLNPDITQGYADDRELNQHLILCALRKRHQLADAYRRQGVNINPLLLIQLPNDTSESMTADDNAIAEQVRAYLQGLHGIDEQNGRLAVWLSKEKTNLDGIEAFDSPVEVLLFTGELADLLEAGIRLGLPPRRRPPHLPQAAKQPVHHTDRGAHPPYARATLLHRQPAQCRICLYRHQPRSDTDSGRRYGLPQQRHPPSHTPRGVEKRVARLLLQRTEKCRPQPPRS